MSLPWVVMGLIILRGGAESVFDFPVPAAMGWPVAAWHAMVVGIWVVAACWIHGWGGAEILADHRAFHNRTVHSAGAFRIWIGAALAGGVVGEIVMWFCGMPPAALG